MNEPWRVSRPWLSSSLSHEAICELRPRLKNVAMISHEHRCIFVHIPKCAGQSIATAFLEDLGLNWATRAVLLMRPNDRPEIGPPRLAHLIARDYLRHHYISRELFDSYFKFAVVRNPWARVVSTYRYLAVNESFADFVKRLTKSFAKGLADNEFWFFRPQIDYVVDENGAMIVDRIVHFEKLATEFERVAAEVNLKTPLRHVNKSKSGRIRQKLTSGNSPRSVSARNRLAKARRDVGALNARSSYECWRDYYNDHTREIVGVIYSDDIINFGYDFENDGPTGSETARCSSTGSGLTTRT
jgi:hypothetical protein